MGTASVISRIRNLTSVILLIATTQSHAIRDLDHRVIYGEDDRKDVYQTLDQNMVTIAASTALVAYGFELKSKSEGGFKLNTSHYGEENGLCNDEAFYAQPMAGFCSAFLVAEDVLVTAGHCISTVSECKEAAFVFGFDMANKDDAITEFSEDNVYRCKEIINQRLDLTAEDGGEETDDGLKLDYAVLRLDRKVVGRTPLKLRRSGDLQLGEKITVIGHPVGLPTKVSGGAAVRSFDKGFFVANLDTYGGNSGSAVVNDVTGEVEGILVRGAPDFVMDTRRQCTLSNVCSDTGCRGEDVTSISHILQYLP